MNSPQPEWNIQHKDYEATFSDATVENAFFRQIPFVDYDKQAGNVAEDNVLSQQTEFVDYEKQDYLDAEKSGLS